MPRRAILLGGIAVVVAACVPAGGLPDMGADPSRLAARPPATAPVPTDPRPGVRALELGPGPEVLLHVPSGTRADAPARLVLSLHGAGGAARAGLGPLAPLADAHRLLVLAPASQGRTWDVIQGGWRPDVRRIDDALEEVFASYPLDPRRLAISGFSDGASYALSLGLANADLFTHILAFSPGFVLPARPARTPAVYISHGRADDVLPIDRTTRRIVPRLRAAGIPVQVHEFDGGHTVPARIAEEAVRHFLG